MRFSKEVEGLNWLYFTIFHLVTSIFEFETYLLRCIQYNFTKAEKKTIGSYTIFPVGFEQNYRYFLRPPVLSLRICYKFSKNAKFSKIWFSNPKNTKLATLQNSDHTAKNGLRIRNQRPKISGNQLKTK